MESPMIRNINCQYDLTGVSTE